MCIRDRDCLSEALHVSVEWLKGETEEMTSDVTDKRELPVSYTHLDVYKRQDKYVHGNMAEKTNCIIFLLMKK